MLKKKNYKQEDHYTEFRSFSLPQPNGHKMIIYFKRYRPKLQSSEKVVEIYDLVHSLHRDKNLSSQVNKASPYPVDRTLELITFDSDLKGKIQGLMKKIGKIRKFQHGTGELKGRNMFYCLVVFKFQFDLVKCFREEYVQCLVQEHFSKFVTAEEQKDQYREEIITKYLGPELASKNKKIKQLHQEGYNLVTNKIGQFKVDRQNNQKWVQDLPQVKKQQKQMQKHADQLLVKQE